MSEPLRDKLWKEYEQVIERINEVEFAAQVAARMINPQRWRAAVINGDQVAVQCLLCNEWMVWVARSPLIPGSVENIVTVLKGRHTCPR